MSKFYLSWDRVETSTFLIKIENKSREKRGALWNNSSTETARCLPGALLEHPPALHRLCGCLPVSVSPDLHLLSLFRSLAGEGCRFVPGCCACANTTQKLILLSPWQHSSGCGSPELPPLLSLPLLSPFMPFLPFPYLYLFPREWAQISTMLREITGLYSNTL